jgi:hypothetical protein
MSGMRGILGIPPGRRSLLAPRPQLKGPSRSISRCQRRDKRPIRDSSVPSGSPPFHFGSLREERPGRAGCEACPLMPLM